MEVTFRIGDWKQATLYETRMTSPPRKGDYVSVCDDGHLREVIEVRWGIEDGSHIVDIVLSEDVIDDSY